jgi:hypothetical protein
MATWLNWLERSDFDPPPSPAKRRLAELGFLASLLNATPPQRGLGFAVLERRQYDKLRPTTATSRAALVRRYGSWHATWLGGMPPDRLVQWW